MAVSIQLHSLTTLPPVKSPLYPLNGRLVGPQNRSEHFGEEKDLFLCQLLDNSPSVLQPIA